MNLTTLVGTCDSYLKYIPNFYTLYKRYFEPTIDIVCFSETKTCPIDELKFIVPGKLPWSTRAKLALDSITTKYTFFILEDYYLCEKLTTDYIEWLLKFMERESADKLILSAINPDANYRYSGKIDNIYKVSRASPWLASVQPSIWRTDYLKELMSKEYSPWEFETLVSPSLIGQPVNHFAIKLHEPIYFNASAAAGHDREGLNDFLKKEQLI